ncbi:MAG: hypothetical protein RMI49_01915 [Candidatus Caldarchaeum sp.]|nr:hypothetical protein [Candidatus Caldarchaeum sp.]
MTDKTLAVAAAASTIAYYLFYLFFTAAAQLFQTPRIGIESISVIFSFIETQLYTGPLLQVVGEGFVLNIRVYPALLGVLISLLVGYNAGILFTLSRKRLLRACLVGSAWSGVGGLLASVISFGYVCCGWPASLALFGVGLITALSPYLTAAAVALLALNAYVLRMRLRAFEKLKNIKKA